MTSAQLREELNSKYQVDRWPWRYEVDHETYANVCQDLFDRKLMQADDQGLVIIALGGNGGIMFKNVELILKRSK